MNKKQSLVYSNNYTIKLSGMQDKRKETAERSAALRKEEKSVILKKQKEENRVKKGSLALRVFLYASLVSLVWLGGYVLLSGLFAVRENTTAPSAPQPTQAVSLTDPVATRWSVLAVVNEEREVTSFWIRYADFLADTLVFIEVPVDTKAELTSGGYEMLTVYNPEVPEMFMVSDLCLIFSEETRCMAAEEIGVSLLGVRPKECYIVEESFYHGITETVNGERRFADGLSVKEVISAVTEHALTDGAPEEEMVYLESYRDIDRIVYRKLPGASYAQEYQPDFDSIAAMMARLQSGDYTE